jgi:hypothetical protein
MGSVPATKILHPAIAKLVVPTRRETEVMRLSDQIVRGIEQRETRAVGEVAYAEFRETLRVVVDSLR